MSRPRKTNKHLPARVYHIHNAFWYVDPTGKWNKLGRDLPAAMVEYARLIDLPDECKTMDDLINRYAAEVIPKKAPATQRDNHKDLIHLRAMFGKMRPTAIKPKHVARFLDVRGETAPVRANRGKALLSHIFTMAMRWGVVDSNPCRGVHRNPEKPRDRYIEDWELEAFCTIAPPLLRVWCALKYLTGLRQTDLRQLRLDQIREDGLHVTTSKTGKKLIFEWSDELRAVIDEAKALRSGNIRALTLFCTRQGQAYSADGFRSIWHRAMTKALQEGVLKERFTEHDIRAKTATDARAQGLDARRLLAHTSEQMTDRYIRGREASKVAPLTRKK